MACFESRGSTFHMIHMLQTASQGPPLLCMLAVPADLSLLKDND